MAGMAAEGSGAGGDDRSSVGDFWVDIGPHVGKYVAMNFAGVMCLGEIIRYHDAPQRPKWLVEFGKDGENFDDCFEEMGRIQVENAMGRFETLAEAKKQKMPGYRSRAGEDMKAESNPSETSKNKKPRISNASPRFHVQIFRPEELSQPLAALVSLAEQDLKSSRLALPELEESLAAAIRWQSSQVLVFGRTGEGKTRAISAAARQGSVGKKASDHYNKQTVSLKGRMTEVSGLMQQQPSRMDFLTKMKAEVRQDEMDQRALVFSAPGACGRVIFPGHKCDAWKDSDGFMRFQPAEEAEEEAEEGMQYSMRWKENQNGHQLNLFVSPSRRAGGPTTGEVWSHQHAPLLHAVIHFHTLESALERANDPEMDEAWALHFKDPNKEAARKFLLHFSSADDDAAVGAPKNVLTGADVHAELQAVAGTALVVAAWGHVPMDDVQHLRAEVDSVLQKYGSMVRAVDVYAPMPDYLRGVTLVDAPGSDDSNILRKIVTTQQLEQHKIVLWVCASSLVKDNASKTMMKEWCKHLLFSKEEGQCLAVLSLAEEATGNALSAEQIYCFHHPGPGKKLTATQRRKMEDVEKCMNVKEKHQNDIQQIFCEVWDEFAFDYGEMDVSMRDTCVSRAMQHVKLLGACQWDLYCSCQCARLDGTFDALQAREKEVFEFAEKYSNGAKVVDFFRGLGDVQTEDERVTKLKEQAERLLQGVKGEFAIAPEVAEIWKQKASGSGDDEMMRQAESLLKDVLQKLPQLRSNAANVVQRAVEVSLRSSAARQQKVCDTILKGIATVLVRKHHDAQQWFRETFRPSNQGRVELWEGGRTMFSIVSAAFEATEPEQKRKVVEVLNRDLRKPICNALQQWLRDSLLCCLPEELQQRHAANLRAHLDDLVPGFLDKSTHLRRAMNLLERWCSDALTVRMSTVKAEAITTSIKAKLLPRLYKMRPATLQNLVQDRNTAKLEEMLKEVVLEARRVMASNLQHRLLIACDAFEKCFHLPADFRVGTRKEWGAVQGVADSNYLMLYRSLVRSCINDSRNGKLGSQEQAWLQFWLRALSKLSPQAAA